MARPVQSTHDLLTWLAKAHQCPGRLYLAGDARAPFHDDALVWVDPPQAGGAGPPTQGGQEASFSRLSVLGKAFLTLPPSRALGWPAAPPGLTAAQFRAGGDAMVRAAYEALLTRLAQVLDDKLTTFFHQAKPGTQEWELFGHNIRWLDESAGTGRNARVRGGACYSYNKSKVRVLGKELFVYQHGVYLRVGVAKGVKEYAHRLVCLIFNGPPQLPVGAVTPATRTDVVSHTCHNKACLNPKHLRWCTPSGNYHQPEDFA